MSVPFPRASIESAAASGRIELRLEVSEALPGGLAILMGLFKSLRIEQMTAASGALREGLLYDTMGRQTHEDVRDRTIERLTVRYGIDAEQARQAKQEIRDVGPQSSSTSAALTLSKSCHAFLRASSVDAWRIAEAMASSSALASRVTMT